MTLSVFSMIALSVFSGAWVSFQVGALRSRAPVCSAATVASEDCMRSRRKLVCSRVAKVRDGSLNLGVGAVHLDGRDAVGGGLTDGDDGDARVGHAFLAASTFSGQPR